MEINIDALREYLTEYCGTAAFNGFPGAFVDLIDIEKADPRELCHIAEELGIDLREFKVNY